MRLVTFLLWQAALTTSVYAFMVTPQSSCRKFTTRTFSSPPENDNEIKRTSFDDAGRSLIEEEDKERLESMGDFDSNPDSDAARMEQMRAALRARAAEVGMEKSVRDQQIIEQRKEQAAAEMMAKRSQASSGQLDLSQISTGDEPRVGKRGSPQWDEDMPTMMYDPADELSEEEQKEVDKVGQLPFYQQAWAEIKESKWPDFPTVIREVITMFLVVAVTGALIIGWDTALREFYTGIGIIPRAEDIPGQLEDLDLPDGFTNNMNEDDLAKLTDEMNKAGGSSASVDKLLEGTTTSNPDL